MFSLLYSFLLHLSPLFLFFIVNKQSRDNEGGKEERKVRGERERERGDKRLKRKEDIFCWVGDEIIKT